MKYEINSIWTKMREKDIQELNNILDDEYCRELEIGRKLNIMKGFKKAFNEAINEFRFDIVLKFMKDNNWKWHHYEDGKEEYVVPTKDRIIKVLREDYLKHGLYNIIELNKTSFSLESGGIVFEMNMIEDNYYVGIYFDIAHFVRDDEI